MTPKPSPSPESQACLYLGGTVRTELVSHLPFSVSSVALGLILAGVICFLSPALGTLPPDLHEGAHEVHGHGRFIYLFHLFHPAHMLFSAAATTAMFWRYDRRVLRAVLVGFSGAVVVCGLSDVVMPHLSLLFLGDAPEHWHICLVEHPNLVLPFAVVGVGVGLAAASSIEKATFFSHSLHVFVSTMASIFYLVGPMGRLAWIEQIGSVFFFTLVAVTLPCCFSDIVYPLFLTRRGRDEYAHAGHAHRH